jgi:VanZ family protein
MVAANVQCSTRLRKATGRQPSDVHSQFRNCEAKFLSAIGRSVFDVGCSAFRADFWMKSFLKYWLPLLIWLGVIFVGSTNVMSTAHTSRYVIPVLLWFKPGMTPETIWQTIVFIRKCGHVTEYAILALLLWRALRSLPSLRTKALMVFGAVLLGCAMFAASDEFHQVFVKSRTPSVRDVVLDVTGAVLGLLIGVSFARRRPREIEAATPNQVVDARL